MRLSTPPAQPFIIPQPNKLRMPRVTIRRPFSELDLCEQKPKGSKRTEKRINQCHGQGEIRCTYCGCRSGRLSGTMSGSPPECHSTSLRGSHVDRKCHRLSLSTLCHHLVHRYNFYASNPVPTPKHSQQCRTARTHYS
jgi:hypothetical protein